MTASARDALSRTTRNVPFPLEVELTKTHPSLARLNVNGWLDLRTEETSSNSETKLFSFFSPANRVFASEAAANRFRRIGNRAEAMTRIFMRCLGLPSGFGFRPSDFQSRRQAVSKTGLAHSSPQ